MNSDKHLQIPNFLSGHRKGPRPFSKRKDFLTPTYFLMNFLLQINFSFLWHHSRTHSQTLHISIYIFMYTGWKHTHGHCTVCVYIMVQIYCTTVHNLSLWTVLRCTQLNTTGGVHTMLGYFFLLFYHFII